MIDNILRKLPEFKGKQRIARMLLKNKMESIRDISIEGKFNCVYKVPNIKESIGFEIYINGVYEEKVIEFIKSQLPANGIFLDLGANIGAITIPLCKVRKDIKALCIEASPRVYKYLQTNAQNNNLTNCILVNKAISTVDGEQVEFFSPIEKFGKGSLSSVFTKDAETIETITVDTLLANNNIANVDFIKVDIEGYEYYAFKGAEKLLKSQTAPDILFEFVDWAEKAAKGVKVGDAQKILIEYGYKLFEFSEDGNNVPINEIKEKGNAMIFASKK